MTSAIEPSRCRQVSVHLAGAQALLGLINAFPQLPDAVLELDRTGLENTPGVAVHVHNHPAAFEAWRAALEIDPDLLDLRLYGSSMTVRGETAWCGVPVSLIGYIPTPPEPPNPYEEPCTPTAGPIEAGEELRVGEEDVDD
jgi:hypothetical protein